MTSFHEAALALAARGIPVFPCEPGTKRPLAGSRGFYEATTDPAQINVWWTQDPERNIAFSPEAAGLCVIDIDGAAGEEAWASLEMVHGEVPTHQVITPRGGRHLYYQGSLPGTQSKLAAHIDTRGRGSYVLAAPSLVDERHEPGYPAGRYQDPDPLAYNAAMPPWVGEVASRVRERQLAASNVALDSPGNLDRARRVVEARIANGNLARQGEGGNAKFFELACELGDLGVSEETCPAIMAPWVTACGPDWADPDALVVTVANAYRYRHNQAGAYASEDVATAFAGVAAAHQEPPRKVKYKAWLLSELDALPPMQWLIPGVLPKTGLAMLFGPWSSGKTFGAIAQLAPLCKAGTKVVFIAGEGKQGVHKRVRAWTMCNPIDEGLFRIVGDMPFPNIEEVVLFCDDLVAQGIKDPDVIVIDTAAVGMTGLDESSAKDVGIFVAICKHVAQRFGCLVYIIHHTGKDADRGARGSSALGGAMDAIQEIKPAGEGVHAIALHVRKVKEAERRKEAFCYQGAALFDTLVYSEVTPTEYRLLTEGDDLYEPRKVGKVLIGLDAVGEARGVTTHVLAVELAGADATPEHVSLIEKALAGRAGGSLSAYAVGAGQTRLWWLPEA